MRLFHKDDVEGEGVVFMKKEYIQPDVEFESFSMCNSIAMSCEVKKFTQSQGACAYQFGSRKVFTSDVTGCKRANGGYPIQDGSMGDGLCYHVPIDTNNLFNS